MGKWDGLFEILEAPHHYVDDEHFVLKCKLCPATFEGDWHGAASAVGNHIGRTHYPPSVRDKPGWFANPLKSEMRFNSLLGRWETKSS
jgi:hypothetical protein